MKLNVVAVGTKMPTWVTEGYQEYAKRMPKECALVLQEVTPAKRGKSGHVEQWMREEKVRILSVIPDDHHVVALDVQGQAWNTEKLAKQLGSWRIESRDVSFIIGGPDGLDDECLQRANQTWSLSALTMPHPIVRIVMAEQLYRAWTILQNHPYHRA